MNCQLCQAGELKVRLIVKRVSNRICDCIIVDIIDSPNNPHRIYNSTAIGTVFELDWHDDIDCLEHSIGHTLECVFSSDARVCLQQWGTEEVNHPNHPK